MELRFPTMRKLAYPRPVIECAHCGEQIFAPDWSEYLDDRKVRHLWACDGCGYRFETIARFPAATAS